MTLEHISTTHSILGSTILVVVILTTSELINLIFNSFFHINLIQATLALLVTIQFFHHLEPFQMLIVNLHDIILA